MAQDNVIELIVKVVDQATVPLNNIAGLVAKGALAAVGAATLVLGKIVKASAEAQRITAKLDQAYENTGRTIGVTREQLDRLADQIEHTTTFSSGLVKEAESMLLMFNRVRGEAFGRTIKVSADLAAKLGVDLPSATRILGAALQDPERGMDRLRRANIVLNTEQRNLVKRFVESGQEAKAQEVILKALEKQVGGTAAAMRNTLGGAIQAAENAFHNLFEMDKAATKDLQEAIEGIVTTLSAPSTKQAIQDFFGLIIEGANKALQVMIGLGSIFNVVGDRRERITRQLEFLRGHREGGLSTGGENSPFGEKAGVFVTPGEVTARIKELEAELSAIDGLVTKVNKGITELPEITVLGRGGPLNLTAEQLDKLQPVVVTATRIVDDLNQKMKDTETEAQAAARAYDIFLGKLKDLQAAKLIDSTEFNRRLQEFQDKNLAEVQVTVKKIDVPQKVIDEGTAALQRMGENIQDIIAGVFDGGIHNVRDFLTAVLQAFRSILAQAAALDLGRLLGLDKLGSGGSSGGSAFGAILKGVGKFIGGLFGAAEGGMAGGVTRVGEEGPETVILPAGSRVMNQRQAAFQGGMTGNVHFMPRTTVTMVPTGDPQRDQRRMQEELDRRDREMMNRWARIMEQNGYGRLR